MKRPPSRSKRWNDACAAIQKTLDSIEALRDDLESQIEELNDVKNEYEEWRYNLPENLQNSALGEKLNTVADMDFDAGELETAISAIQDLISEAEGADLPLGFGRD